MASWMESIAKLHVCSVCEGRVCTVCGTLTVGVAFNSVPVKRPNRLVDWRPGRRAFVVLPIVCGECFCTTVCNPTLGYMEDGTRRLYGARPNTRHPSGPNRTQFLLWTGPTRRRPGEPRAVLTSSNPGTRHGHSTCSALRATQPARPMARRCTTRGQPRPTNTRVHAASHAEHAPIPVRTSVSTDTECTCTRGSCASVRWVRRAVGRSRMIHRTKTR